MTHGPWPQIAFAQRTDPGRDPDKRVNEDSSGYEVLPLGHALVVCDGMGGHLAGREASQLAVATILDELRRAPPGAAPGEALRAAIATAGRRVFELGGPGVQPARPGSTCVALLVHPGGTEVAHIGDSRVYLVRGGQIWPLTRDHSMVQQLVDAGLLRQEEAATHPDSNKITRALGMAEEAEVELRREPLPQERGDLFLLVTDGVTDVVKESDLLAVATVAIERKDVTALCEQVVTLANARGGPDNITVQAALVLEPGLTLAASARRTGAAPTLASEEPSDERHTHPTYPGGIPVPATIRLARHGTVPIAEPPPATPVPATPGTSPAAVTAPGTPFAPPAAATPPAAAAPAPPPKPRVAGGTVKLPVATPPADAQGTAAATRGRAAPTVVDEEPPHAEEPPRPPPSRGRRVLVGLALAAIGVGISVASIRALLFDDEAPPPLVEPPSTAGSAVAPATSGSAR